MKFFSVFPEQNWVFSSFSLCTFDLLRSLSFFYCGYLESKYTLVYGLEETKNTATESKFSYERSEFIESANKAPESPDWLHT